MEPARRGSLISSREESPGSVLLVPDSEAAMTARPAPFPGSPQRRRAPALLLSAWVAALVVSSVAAAGAATAASTPPAPGIAAPLPGKWVPVAPPTGRRNHTTIYDPVRDRLVVFGGHDDIRRAEVWTLSLGSAPRWAFVAIPGPAPSARYQHAAVYDPVRDRMIVFGGDDGHLVNDVWALSLAGPMIWTELIPAGAPPPARYGHSMIYDPAADRLVVFGGKTATQPLADTWSLNLAGTPAWSPIAAAGAPPARYRHSAIHDPVRGRMLVFGGNGDLDRNDTWELPLSGDPVWTEIPAAAGPSTREGHSAIYDPVRDGMIVFGGSGVDCWFLRLHDAPEWSRLPNGTGRARHTATYDPVRDRMIVIGGAPSAYPHRVDALLLSVPAWQELDTGNPAGRHGAGMVYDPVGARMILFGGGDFVRHYNDTWSLDLTGAPRWAPLPTTGAPPPSRVDHSAIYDPVGHRMLVFGGWNGTTALSDLWELTLADPPTWRPLTTLHDPEPRLFHSATYDPVHHRMIVIGGLDRADGIAFGDVWVLPLTEPLDWSKVNPAGAFPARAQHGALYDGARDRILVHGGGGASGELGDVRALSLAGDPAWSLVDSSAYALRVGHVAVYDPLLDRMLLWGGRSSDPWLDHNDIVAFPLDGASPWSTPEIAGAPPPGRLQGAAAYDPAHDRWIVATGYAESGHNADTWILDRGAPLLPTVECGPDLAGDAGDSLPASFELGNGSGESRLLVWSITSERDWPGFPLRGFQFSDGARIFQSLDVEIPIPDSVVAGINRLRLAVSYFGGATTSCERRLSVQPTAISAALVSGESDGGRVLLRWHLAGRDPVAVERREASTEWTRLGELAIDGTGLATYEDRAVRPGARYGYRLTAAQAPFEPVSGETWIDVTETPELALHGARPNPATADPSVAFTLPAAGRVTLDCFDVTGRRVATDTRFLAAGQHVVSPFAARRLAPGIYVLRLEFGGRELRSRIAIVR